MSAAKIKGEITEELNSRGVTVTWLPMSKTAGKFTFNTNIRHEDEMGRDLELKDIKELCDEFKHCGYNLILTHHRNDDNPHICGELIYYDSK